MNTECNRDLDNTNNRNLHKLFTSPSVSSRIPASPGLVYHNARKLSTNDVTGYNPNLQNKDLNCATVPTSLLSSSSVSGMSCSSNNISIRHPAAVAAEKPQERYVWEMRTRSPNITPVSTVLNSPDLNTDMQYSLHGHNRQHHHQIRVGRSPGSQFDQNTMLPQGLTSPGSPTDVGGQCLRDGEIVVFDDIDTNWMNKTNNVNISKDNELHSNHPNCQNHHHNNEDILKVTKMIGQLPIADYEGSPRRFGNQPATVITTSTTATTTTTKQQQQTAINNTSTYPKRPPGFPQRVSPTKAAPLQSQQHPTLLRKYLQQQQQQQQHKIKPKSVTTNSNLSCSSNNGVAIGDCSDAIITSDKPSLSENNETIGNLIDIDNDCCDANIMKTKTSTFDYLYEFSETRKVLEEFFKGNQEDDRRFTDFTESGDDVGSCLSEDMQREREEEKHLKEAYIGQRLAKIPNDELYLIHRSPKKQQQQPPVCDTIYKEDNDIELYIDSNSRSSGDLADTELEANIRRHSRNFTLSPETTDYDSNCGDLDSLSNDMINCTTDYGKLYTSMPVLEDGLSSGHASDTENNAPGSVGKCEKKKYETISNENEQEQSQQFQQPERQQQMIVKNDYNDANLSIDCYKNCKDNVGNNCILNPNTITNFVDMSDEQNQQQQQQKQQHQQSSSSADTLEQCDTNCFNNSAVNPVVSVGSHELSHSHSNSNSINYEAVYAASALSATMNSNKQSPLETESTQPTVGGCIIATHQPTPRSKQHRESTDIQEAMKEIRSALQRAKTQPEKLKFCDEVLPPGPDSPIWVPRLNHLTGSGVKNKSYIDGSVSVGASGGGGGGEEEEPDTDLETDRLLGQQRLDDHGYFDEKTIWPKTTRISVGGGVGGGGGGSDSNDLSPSTSDVTLLTSNSLTSIKPQNYSSATIRQGLGTSLTPTSPDRCQIVGSADVALTSPEKLQYTKSPTGSNKSLKDSAIISNKKAKSQTRNKEGLLDPAVLIEGVLFRARYLGSTQLVCEGQPTKSTRMMQAEEAVSRIKAPEGESQPSTEVDLFISTEKIMVLNTDLKEIMMDHALRTISYIADIGDLVVLMARRRFVPSDSCSSDVEANGSGSGGNNLDATNTNTNTTSCGDSNKENKENGNANGNGSNSSVGSGCGSGSANVSVSGNGSVSNSKQNRTPKMICHVFESDEAQFIAQSIGQAFQVAYMEFLKANGIEDHSFVKEMDYQEVLNSQEIFGDELEIFAKKELQKEVVVPKAKGEILGVVIVESGWGSMLPTVVIANLMSSGAAARCGQLNIGDQLIAINGMSLVGLPLSTCQSYIRNAKNQTAVKFTVVPCPPVVEVKIKRPNTKYQLGFSVQNGVICSLLRGGIAERGGVRVGHRIIEINNQSVVAVPHEKIVNLLATSVGEILMKTMPTSMFRLLTGQENPIYI